MLLDYQCRRHVLLSLMLCCFAGFTSLPAIELHQARASSHDMEIRGKLTGVPFGEFRYVRWADLKGLPTSRLILPRAFGIDGPELTVLYLSDLWAALPHSPTADTLLAICQDGYASVYPEIFIGTYRPFIVLEINGHGPADWPPPGVKHDFGPYVITIAAEVAPAVAKLLDGSHKRPWGVVALEFTTYAESFADAYRGKWTEISARAATGRDLWINSCASCHRGPGQMFGGTKSERPFEALVALAIGDAGYFRQYVRNPKSKVPGATMEPHPHYTDEHLAALIAFITAEPK